MHCFGSAIPALKPYQWQARPELSDVIMKGRLKKKMETIKVDNFILIILVENESRKYEVAK